MKWIFPILMVLGIACKKNTDDIYYVKYIVDGKSAVSVNNGLWIFINNENGGETDYFRSNKGVNDFTIGPVKKGFIAKLVVKNACPSSCVIRPLLQIQISQNNGPFTIKREEAFTTNIIDGYIEFTIN
jgi:hypothetical protein